MVLYASNMLARRGAKRLGRGSGKLETMPTVIGAGQPFPSQGLVNPPPISGDPGRQHQISSGLTNPPPIAGDVGRVPSQQGRGVPYYPQLDQGAQSKYWSPATYDPSVLEDTGKKSSRRKKQNYGFGVTVQSAEGYMPGTRANDQRRMKSQADAMAKQYLEQYGGQAGLRQAAAAGLLPAGVGPSSGNGRAGGLGGAYQDAFDSARNANERRYQDILGGYQNRYERNMDRLEGMGGQERRDINRQYNASAAAMRQGLTNRGLSNSTVLDTMNMGNERERADSQGRLEERLRQQLVAADTALSGDTLQFMERREDEYPDYNQLAALAQAQGAAGGGGIGGGAPIFASASGYGYNIPPVSYGGLGYSVNNRIPYRSSKKKRKAVPNINADGWDMGAIA